MVALDCGFSAVRVSMFTRSGSTLPVTEFGMVMILGPAPPKPGLRYEALPVFFEPTCWPEAFLRSRRTLRSFDLSV